MTRQGQAQAQRIETVGLIGLGSFGNLAAKLVPPDVAVLAYDPQIDEFPAGVERVGFSEVAAADVVIPAVPLEAYPYVLAQLAGTLPAASLLLDVCSVKTEPRKLIDRHLPDHPNVLLTHPLFGPQTAAESTAGHLIVVTEANGSRARALVHYFGRTLGLKIVRRSNAEHDKTMAVVHDIPFFVGRVLAGMSIETGGIETPSFRAVRSLVDLDGAHSDALFDTIQLGNPYASMVRNGFVAQAQRLNMELAEKLLHSGRTADMDLKDFRAELDAIDTTLVWILAQRFLITDMVGRFKKQHQLEAFDGEREAAQSEQIEVIAAKAGLPPGMASTVLTAIRREVVKRHELIMAATED